MGTCAACGVRFDAADAVAGVVGDLLRLHALVCDRGDRRGVAVVPFPVAAQDEPAPRVEPEPAAAPLTARAG